MGRGGDELASGGQANVIFLIISQVEEALGKHGHDADVNENGDHHTEAALDGVVENCFLLCAGSLGVNLAGLDERRVQEQVVRHNKASNNASSHADLRSAANSNHVLGLHLKAYTQDTTRTHMRVANGACNMTTAVALEQNIYRDYLGISGMNVSM